MTNSTFFWHDYETFGIDPQRDRASQFAGIRTDQDFNVIDDPVMLYCQTADDYLPQPEACLITGITPQLATEKGVCEAEFIRIIHHELSQAGTCGLGYNSLRFDDEVTRNLLYRNFYDPYGREFQNNNSRWDLIDVVRATYALRPDGINWPLNDEGVATFRLELLTKANDISHQAAHDALSDVYATIAMAKLVKQRQPRLYEFLYQNRYKHTATDLLDVGSFKPVVHISGRFAAKNHCLGIVLPLCEHPLRKTEIIVYDLSVDPAPLLELSAEEIQQRVFTATADLAEGVERIPLKTIHINKYPVIAPYNVIRAADAERLNLDLANCQRHLQTIQAQATGLNSKLAQVFGREYGEGSQDPDLMIYSGGFFTPKDKATMTKIRQTAPEKLGGFKADFVDDRLEEMLFRYRGRNYPNTLNSDELQQWQQFCRQRLDANTLESYQTKLVELQASYGEDHQILKQLLAFAQSKQNTLA